MDVYMLKYDFFDPNPFGVHVKALNLVGMKAVYFVFCKMI